MLVSQLPSKGEFIVSEKYCLVCADCFSFSEDRFSRVRNVDPVVALIGKEKSTDDDGFLDVELALVEALWLAKILKRYGIQAFPIPNIYRKAGVALNMAKGAAQKHVDDIRSSRQDSDLSNVEEIPLPWAISKMAYGFIAKSEKMRVEGRSPAGMTLCVDRVSGDVLSPRDLLDIELSQMLID
ncbi:hypothetical protein [Ralstonia pseudosolanacearum]|uniref:hypothetical protein n=1 Tax=Ralstonia pseudosolanacearum TaxID=1310165 RepID=UPI001FF72492|nr:hypothetical protein [Ralstonia pseudosolanacearum]